MNNKTESTDLAIIEEITEDRYPEVYGRGNLNQFVERVRQEVTGEVPDLETAKGRARIASLARKVSNSKVAVEKPGRDYLRQIKELPKTIEAELREFVREMDALRDETRKPLTEWEQAEAERKAKHSQAIEHIRALATSEDETGYEFTAAELAERLAEVNAIKMGDQWEEFESEAARAKEAAIETLSRAIEKREKYEAEQAELERLRKEQAEKEQREREERIRQEAIEAERKAAKERAEAEAKARKEAEERAERERQHELDKAKREKAEAEARELRAKQEAEARQKKAVEDERARIEAERIAAEKEAQRKAENKRHRAKINREVLADLEKFGLDSDVAKRLVEAIASGEVSHTSINY